MAIKEERPITLSEVVGYLDDSERAEEIRTFMTNFKLLDKKKAAELKKKLEALDLIKLKEEHIVKMIDFVPRDATELNKVLSDVSLDEAETTKILDVVGAY